MNELTVKVPGPDLASRKTAAAKRLRIINALSRERKVVSDLSDVLSISDSYADELFGVLAAVHGLDWLREKVKIRGARGPVLRSIALAIKRRITTTGPADKVA